MASPKNKYDVWKTFKKLSATSAAVSTTSVWSFRQCRLVDVFSCECPLSAASTSLTASSNITRALFLLSIIAPQHVSHHPGPTITVSCRIVESRLASLWQTPFNSWIEKFCNCCVSITLQRCPGIIWLRMKATASELFYLATKNSKNLRQNCHLWCTRRGSPSPIRLLNG